MSATWKHERVQQCVCACDLSTMTKFPVSHISGSKMTQLCFYQWNRRYFSVQINIEINILIPTSTGTSSLQRIQLYNVENNCLCVFFSVSFVSSHTFWGSEQILCVQDPMGWDRLTAEGSKLHPTDRIWGRRSAGAACAERARAGWSGLSTSPAQNLRGAKSRSSVRATGWKLKCESVSGTRSRVILKEMLQRWRW